MKVPAKAAPGYNLEQMKAFIIRHLEQLVNQKYSDVALVNFSEDFLDHDENYGPAGGSLAAKEMIERAFERWPDLHVEILDILAEDDRVMARNGWSGTEKITGKKLNSMILFCGYLLTKKLLNVGLILLRQKKLI